MPTNNTLDIKTLYAENRASYLLDALLYYSLGKSYISNNLELLKEHNSMTYFHSLNVAKISMIIGAAMNMKHTDLRLLCDAALMHDIGKLFISMDLLNKEDKLTAHEFNTLKKHTVLGYNYIIYNVQGDAALGALEHHERVNGSGYPRGLRGHEISLYGRIIAIADVYEAITSERPYKEAGTATKAIEFISDNVDTMFDNDIVRKFREISSVLIGVITDNK
jgi:HD-GYP domain-containing protein (c-di-GMP phosphodiesterase class II)